MIEIKTSKVQLEILLNVSSEDIEHPTPPGILPLRVANGQVCRHSQSGGSH